MATPLGTDVVTALSRRYIMPEIVDQVYDSNALTFRLIRSNRRIIQGGTQIEVPFMYKGFTVGGPYQGYEVLSVAPQDTVKNGAWDWKQHYITVAVDGLTLIKFNTPEAIADYTRLQFKQGTMEMIDNLGVGIWSDTVTNPKEIDGLEGAVDDGGVATTYGGLTRASNTYLNAVDDSSTATLTMDVLQAWFMNGMKGGRHYSIILSRKEQYNRYWALHDGNQRFPVAPMGHDEQLASAGFTNLFFNNVPWLVDSHVFDGPNTSNSAIVGLDEEFIHLAVSPRADFYLEPFQTPIDQDAMVSKVLWAGNLIVTAPQLQGKMTAVTG